MNQIVQEESLYNLAKRVDIKFNKIRKHVTAAKDSDVTSILNTYFPIPKLDPNLTLSSTAITMSYPSSKFAPEQITVTHDGDGEISIETISDTTDSGCQATFDGNETISVKSQRTGNTTFRVNVAETTTYAAASVEFSVTIE